MKKKYFFCETGIPYLKGHLRKRGEWREFHNIKQLSDEIDSGYLRDEFEQIEEAIFFIKTSTSFNTSWETLGPLLKKIKVIGSAAVGTDHINFHYLKKKNIHFFNSPGCNSSAVTDYIFFVLFKYCVLRNKSFSSLTVAILGLGNIGSRIATQLLKLNVEVVAFDPLFNPLLHPKRLRNHPQFGNHPLLTFCSCIDELLSHQSVDIITLHVPLTPKTYRGEHPTFHLINEHALTLITQKSIKSTTKGGDKKLLINSSRGEVVDERSLLSHLDHLDYATDVWENEPELSLRVAKKSFFITPHIAGYTHRAKRKAAEILSAKVMNYLSNKNMRMEGSIHPIPKISKKKLSINLQKFGEESLEKILYQVCRKITGLETIQKKMLTILNYPKNKRGKLFLGLRKKILRQELGEFDLSLSSSISKKNSPKTFGPNKSRHYREIGKTFKAISNSD